MKKTIFIVGGILALGVVGYLFLKNKKKQEALLGGVSGGSNQTASTSNSTAQSGGTSSSTAQSGSTTSGSNQSAGGNVNSTNSVEEQANLDKANDIASKIRLYYKYSASRDLQIKMWKPSTFNRIAPTNPYPTLINKLKDELLNLGYRFEGTTNGVIIKI